MTARRSFAAAFAAVLALPLAAAAAEVEPFTPAAIDAAEAAGRPIPVDVTTPPSLSERRRSQASPSLVDRPAASSRSMSATADMPWCPTCKAQRPILSNLEADPKFKDFVVLDVDFDAQKDALRQLGVPVQSTLIAFKGGRETARSAGETRPEPIARLLDSML